MTDADDKERKREALFAALDTIEKEFGTFILFARMCCEDPLCQDAHVGMLGTSVDDPSLMSAARAWLDGSLDASAVVLTNLENAVDVVIAAPGDVDPSKDN